MRLLLDIGNTRVKWASWQDGRLSPGGALRHEAFFVALAGDGLGLAAPEAVLLACVGAEALRQAFDAALRARWSLAGQWAESRAEDGGLRNVYAEPARLGVDRWLAMLAARRRAQGAVLVVDAGSALTLDFVDATGLHRGGLIVPGLAMARQALFAGTGQVRFPLKRECRPAEAGAWGLDTEQAVKYGSLWSAVGLVEYMSRRDAGACVLTGGDAAQLSTHLGVAHRLCPDLVLEGLCLQAGWELRD